MRHHLVFHSLIQLHVFYTLRPPLNHRRCLTICFGMLHCGHVSGSRSLNSGDDCLKDRQTLKTHQVVLDLQLL